MTKIDIATVAVRDLGIGLSCRRLDIAEVFSANRLNKLAVDEVIDLRVGLHRLRAGARLRVSTREIKHRTSNVQHPIGNGEGGIRTLGTLLGYGALAKRCFRPLSHLTKFGRENMTSNQRLPIW